MSNIYEASQRSVFDAAEIAQVIPDGTVRELPDEKIANPLNFRREEGKGRTVRIKASNAAPVFPFDGSDTRAAEQYRMIRTKIVQDVRRPRLIAVSSSSSGDGKTITSVNIAAALSLNNSGPVLLVDGDFRRSRIASVLGIQATPGMNEVLSGTCELDDILIRLEQFPNLFVAVAGKGFRNAAELLDSPRWVSLCASFREQFQFIIVDTPPIAAVADYDLIQAAMDGVIVVIRPDHSRRAICLEALKAVPENLMLGVVLNCVDDWFLWKNREYYYSNYTD